MFGSGFDNSNNRDCGRGNDLRKRQRSRRVACNDEETGSLLFEEVRCLYCVARDGLSRLAAIGKPGRVTEVEIIGVRDQVDELLEDGESAEAGIEDTDGGPARHEFIHHKLCRRQDRFTGSVRRLWAGFSDQKLNAETRRSRGVRGGFASAWRLPLLYFFRRGHDVFLTDQVVGEVGCGDRVELAAE